MFTTGSTRGLYVVVAITSAERNAVFDIWEPGYKIGPGNEVKGNRLKGAIEATEYSGQLTATGSYLIVVGGKRGNVEYGLTLAVTDPYGVTTRTTATEPAAPR